MRGLQPLPCDPHQGHHRDNRYVAAHLAESIGLAKKHIITGQQLAPMTKNAVFAVASI
jgi:hypothetical protein